MRHVYLRSLPECAMTFDLSLWVPLNQAMIVIPPDWFSLMLHHHQHVCPFIHSLTRQHSTLKKIHSAHDQARSTHGLPSLQICTASTNWMSQSGNIYTRMSIYLSLYQQDIHEAWWTNRFTTKEWQIRFVCEIVTECGTAAMSSIKSFNFIWEMILKEVKTTTLLWGWGGGVR